MIDSLHNVDENFYKIFLGENLNQKVLAFRTHKGETMQVPFIFAKASALNFNEKSKEVYPIISLENYTPELIVNRDVFYKYNLGSYKLGTDLKKFEQVGLEFEDTPMLFKYDLHTACKSESDWDAIKKFFIKNFSTSKIRPSVFVFNKVAVEHKDNLGTIEEIGDYVEYNFKSIDIPRSDGIFETVFSFEIEAWVTLEEQIFIDLINSAQITLNSQSDIVYLENN